MQNVYLDTNVALRPFDPPPLNREYQEIFNKCVATSERILTRIDTSALQWSTSDHFIRQFYRWVFDPDNNEAIQQKPVARQTLQFILRLLKAAYSIKVSNRIKEEANSLQDQSSPVVNRRLEYEDALHIILSFRAMVDKFLTYDHSTILDDHKEYINQEGRKVNLNFSCEDPVETGFP